MKLDCKDILISDEAFGCTITFYHQKERIKWENNMSIEEFTRSISQYILLQRSYGDDEFEEDYYYFETIDFNNAWELNDLTIAVYRKKILINYNGERFEITIHVNNQKFEDLKLTLKKIVNREGELKIYE